MCVYVYVYIYILDRSRFVGLQLDGTFPGCSGQALTLHLEQRLQGLVAPGAGLFAMGGHKDPDMLHIYIYG